MKLRYILLLAAYLLLVVPVIYGDNYGGVKDVKLTLTKVYEVK